MALIDKVSRQLRATIGPRQSAPPLSRPPSVRPEGDALPGVVHADDEAACDWIGRARAIADIAVRDADEAERIRHLTDPVAAAIKDADFARMMVPKAFGGYQESLVTGIQVVEELAKHDGSLGWNVWVVVGHGRTADCMTEIAAEKVFGGRSVLAGSLQPSGSAIAVDGGYRVSGQWPFASACYIADWLVGAGPVRGKHGDGEVLAYLMPASECEILDTWHTTGLHATGSEDYRADEVFVPEEFTFPAQSVFDVLPARPSTGYGRPYSEYSSMLMSAVALGITRHAIDSYRTIVAGKRGDDGSPNARLDALHDDRVGRAEALYQSSRAWLYEVGHELDAVRPTDPSRVVKARLVGAHVAKTCEQAVDLLYDVAGRAAIYTVSPLERCFRDVHMVSHHTTISFSAFADAGQELIATAQR